MRFTGLNQDDNKMHNRALILKLIQQNPGISRVDLSNLTDLSKPTITNIVNPFINSGVLVEQDDGRLRNKGLIFKEDTLYIVSIYLGRLAITGAIFDLSGKMILEERLPLGVKFYGNDDLPDHALHLIELLQQKSKLSLDTFLAIGIAAPGAVTIGDGAVFNRSVAADDSNSSVPFNWGKIHLVEFLKKKMNIPVFIDNNSNLSALAEAWFGKGLGVKNFVQYSIGIGIGGGAILNGRIFRGNDNIVCEIGHTTVDIHGEKCFCGNTGCLETVAGFKKIIEKYEEVSTSLPESKVEEKLHEIFKAAEEGDVKARKILKEHAEYLGVGAVSLINMYSPEKIIISVNDLENLPLSILVEEIEAYIRKHAYPIISEKVVVEVSELGAHIHLIGAYALILENLFTLISDKIEVD